MDILSFQYGKMIGINLSQIKQLIINYQLDFLIQKELLRFRFWMDMWRIADFIYKIVK